MKPYDEEAALVAYIWSHFQIFLTRDEGLAAMAAFAEEKSLGGSTHVKEVIWEKNHLGDEPNAIQLLADGINAFRRRVALRILAAHGSEIYINRCPRCASIVRTPKAQQCLWCGYDWHPAVSPR